MIFHLALGIKGVFRDSLIDIKKRLGEILRFKMATDNDAHKFCSSKGFRILHSNVRSIINKISDLCLLVSKLRPHVFCVTESWLKSDISDCEVEIQGYKIYRFDREAKIGGGIIIYVMTNLNLVIERKSMNSPIEHISLEMKFKNTKSFILTTIYNPPNSKLFLDHFKIFMSNFENYEHIILGDFNINYAKKNDSKLFVKLIKDHGFKQLINNTTHFTATSESLIDLILSNTPENISNSGVLNYSVSDHFFTFVTRKLKQNIEKSSSIIEIDIIDYDRQSEIICELSKLNFSELYSSKLYNSNAFATHLTSKILHLFSRFKKTIKRRVKHKIKPSFLTAEVCRLIKERNKLFNNYWKKRKIGLNDTTLFSNYKMLRNKVLSLIRIEKEKSMQKQINDNKHNAKKLWKILSQKFGKEKQETNFKFDLNELNRHFSKTDKIIENRETEHSNTFLECFSFNEITENDVIRAFKCLKKSKSVGADNLSLKMIKIALPFICIHLVSLFNLIIKSNEFPNIWKISKITPIEKKKNAQKINEFRPISVLSTLSKLFERLIYNQIHSFLEQNNLIFEKQYGFRKNLSTSDALLAIHHKIISSRNAGYYVSMLQLDLTDAFGSVSHDILLSKCKKLGFSKSAIKLIQSYLFNRKQYIVHKSEKSLLNDL
ncbi:rna-directed dna polymerase from mobile element jockey-like protein, partial [Leptotrombidium deliense]